MKILPWKKKEPEKNVFLEEAQRAKRKEKLFHSLESALLTEWQGKEMQFQRDVSLQRSRLEAEGFSAYFTYKFAGFIDLLRFSYTTVIDGESLEKTLQSQFKDYSEIGSGGAPQLFTQKIDITELMNLPKEEWYKLQVPAYALARGAKELVKLSPIGEAITQYRQAHPFPPLPTLPAGAASLDDVDITYSEKDVRRIWGSALIQVEKDDKRPLIDRKDFHLLQAHSRFGLQMEYVPMHLFGDHLRSMQAEVDYLGKRPYLHGSDAGEGDFYYAAFDLLQEEREFFNLTRTKSDSANPHQILSGLNLITAGNGLPHFYAQKFLDARKKLEKYGVDSLEKYFTQQAVGENGKDGKLRLFQPNLPAQRRYRHIEDE